MYIAAVRATWRKQRTRQLWMEGRGGVWILLFSEIILQQFCRQLQKKCPFPVKKDVPSEKGDRYKDHDWHFSRTKNFVSPEWRYPLNRGTQKGRFHCNILLFCSNLGHLWERRSYCYEDIWWSRYDTLAITVYITTEWAASIPENTVIWLVHISNYLLLSWLLQTKLELCYLTRLITCSN